MTQKKQKSTASKPKIWTDFKELKSRITLEMVLDHYGLLGKLKPSGANLVGTCPIHHGTNPRQFSVNLGKNAFNCFGNCQAGGNVLDFVAKMEKIDLRQAALLLQEWFLAGDPGPAPSTTEENTTLDQPSQTKLVTEEKELTNPPLKFVLKNLNPDHAFLHERGITLETANQFGLGFCAKGMMANRIAIPIHDQHGHLVAYVGRAISEEQSQEEGKYKLPPGFIKKAVAYNLHRQPAEQKTLILVESVLSVVKGHQAGIENIVALLGSVLSREQENLITGLLGPSGHVLLLFDTDESGQACADDCQQRLGQQLFVKRINLETFGVRKPHHLTSEDWPKVINPVSLPKANSGGDNHDQ